MTQVSRSTVTAELPAPRPVAQTAAVVAGLATAHPEMYVTPQETYEFLCRHFEMSAATRDLYHRILMDGPIRGRRLALESHEQALEMDMDRQLERFTRYGTRLGSQAAAAAMAQAGVKRSQVSALVVNTCTGYLCPGLSSYIAQAMDLPAEATALDLVGMGCGAALPNLHMAARLAETDKTVLSVAVEICSATMQMGEDESLVISNCIFSDAAAAAVIKAIPRADRHPDDSCAPKIAILDFESSLDWRSREHLRYRTEGGHLRNVLSPRVPVLAGRNIAALVERLLVRHGLSRGDIDWWIVHPGGTRVLEQIQQRLGLRESDLRFSYEVFRRYGNMSSPSVLAVLDKVLKEGQPKTGQKGLLLAFGAGFSAFGLLVSF